MCQVEATLVNEYDIYFHTRANTLIAMPIWLVEPYYSRSFQVVMFVAMICARSSGLALRVMIWALLLASDAYQKPSFFRSQSFKLYALL